MNSTTMDMDIGMGIGLTILPILSLLLFLIPFVLVIWYMFKSINLQKERNKILRDISDKLN
ncbi:hypothetical protein [Lysinibacillus sp. RC79]|uniref:hypothetical protein n=1 Tax=Lysinibacillus sp. RC79 TaxID=3156296 RepID=UPI003519A191